MITRNPGQVAAALGLVLVLLAGCASSGSNKAGGQSADKALVLTLANPFGNSEEVDGFAAEVSRLSRGTIRIDVESRWRIGQIDFENGLIGDVRDGRADLGAAGTRAWDSVGVRTFDALAAPLLINTYALQAAVLSSPLPAQMLRGLAPVGLVGLGVLPGPLRFPIGVTRALRGPSDYSAQRIGATQSLSATATLHALGATPVWLAVEAPIAGLNGAEQGIENIEGDHSDRPVSVTANVVLWPRPVALFANREVFSKLAGAQQRILMEAARDDLAPEIQVVREAERTSAANLCRSHLLRFVTATPDDLVALRRAVQPVYAALDRDPQTRREIAHIEAMRGGIVPQPPLSCAEAVQPLGRASPLDGVYQFTLSFANLQTAGADPSELVPENVGRMTFVFDRGHFAFTQEYPQGQACTWGYGTLKLHGDTLTQLFTDGGGIAPTNSENRPGEEFTFKWSLYRDALTLRRVAGAVSPTPDVATPWIRISTTPSRSYFANRCAPPADALPPG
jgi:TRAP-type transport system periplasmic protein